jgi:hypothetical protein
VAMARASLNRKVARTRGSEHVSNMYPSPWLDTAGGLDLPVDGVHEDALRSFRKLTSGESSGRTSRRRGAMLMGGLVQGPAAWWSNLALISEAQHPLSGHAPAGKVRWGSKCAVAATSFSAHRFNSFVIPSHTRRPWPRMRGQCTSCSLSVSGYS